MQFDIVSYIVCVCLLSLWLHVSTNCLRMANHTILSSLSPSQSHHPVSLLSFTPPPPHPTHTHISLSVRDWYPTDTLCLSVTQTLSVGAEAGNVADAESALFIQG